MDYLQLGEKVKAKYPQYKDMDSAELGKRTASKHPQYAALIKVETKQPSILDNMKSNMTNRETRPLGVSGLLGLGMSAAGIPEENAFPLIGDVAGTLGGAAIGTLALPVAGPAAPLGASSIGSALGTTVGELAKQSAQNLRGTRKGIDINEAADSGALSGGLNLATGGLMKAVMPKGKAVNFLKEGGKKLGIMISDISEKSLKDPALSTSSQPILDFIDNELKNLSKSGKTGKAWTQLVRIQSELKNNPVINFNMLHQQERNLGDALKFDYSTGLSNKKLNDVGKAIRTLLSDTNDNLAKKAGYSEFSKLSKQISSAKKVVGKKAQSIFDRAIDSTTKSIGYGVVAGQATGSKLLGSLLGAAEYIASNPEAQGQMLKLVNNPLTQTAGYAGKEVARGLFNNGKNK